MTKDIFGDLVLGRNKPCDIKGAVPKVAGVPGFPPAQCQEQNCGSQGADPRPAQSLGGSLTALPASLQTQPL